MEVKERMTPQEIPIKEINKYEWEVPKTYRKEMNVPVRIYATREQLNKMMQDRTVEQGVNVATLPGIYKYSIILPDGHQGYGFSIGGVAAFDAVEGVISPGGIGYDINCLPGDTRVLSPLGYYVMLRDLSIGSDIVSVGNNTINSRVVYHFSRFEKEIYVVRTASGRVLRLSYDHPVLTRKGMVVAEDLKVGDYVALYPFDGQSYEPVPDMVLVDEDSLPSSSVRVLKASGLIPLKTDDPRFPLLVRILGYFIGNGAFDGKMTWFYGYPDGLELIRRDIMRLGFKPSPIYHRRRRSKIDGKEFVSDEYSFKVSAWSFRRLLVALGAPEGRKSKARFSVPELLFKMPKWVKRLFLAGYFGTGLEKPHTSNGYNFSDLRVTIIKDRDYVDSGIEFLEGVRRLLSDLDIETSEIYRVEYDDRVLLRLIISSKPENLIKLWTEVGYDYNPKRMNLGLAAATYLAYKMRVLEYRDDVMKLSIEMYESGSTSSEIVGELGSEYTGRRFIERSIYGNRDEIRIPPNFPKFEEWLQNHFDGIRIWNEIVSIEKTLFNDYVYDITVDRDEHNFIADGFIVSNCGVRVMRTDLDVDDVKPRLRELADALFHNVPAGLGSRRKDFRVNYRELDEVARGGAQYIIEKHGLGWAEDAEHIEERGRMEGADPSKVSDAAKKRGLNQLGTLGSGNHFLEVQMVDKIFDEKVAKAFGITHVGQVTVMIHTGSRGFGHQICTDYLRVMDRLVHKMNIKLVDRELVYAPVNSREAEDYIKAFKCGVNFAFANRQAISHWVRQSFEEVFKTDADKLGMNLVYGIAHNIAKLEEHDVDGKRVKVYVHRKGATRSLPAGHPLTPQDYKSVGQPVLIPGSMGTASYILVGLPGSLEKSFGSAPHGSGRVMSRRAAKRHYRADQILRELGQKGILVRADSKATIVEETDAAYKDVNSVALVAEVVGIAKRVARMVPLAVVKG